MSIRKTDPYETGFDEENGKTISATECPECDGRLETDGGEVTCLECGLIVNEYWIDHAAEKRSFPDDEREMKRTGSPLTSTRHDRGLATEIGYKRDSHGNTLSAGTRRRFRRLRTHHNRARWSSKAEQNLAMACGEIARMTGALDLGWEIREQACELYRAAMGENLIVGRSIEAIAAACVYAVCRCAGVGRRRAEIVAVARVDELAITNAYRVINTELGLETAIIRPQTLLPRLVSELDIDCPPMVRRDAEQLIAHAETAGIANGRRPSGVAAACLYLVLNDAGLSVAQTTLADLAGTTPTTIRARCAELRELR
jgi:transcription initiation factor TFIIB